MSKIRALVVFLLVLLPLLRPSALDAQAFPVDAFDRYVREAVRAWEVPGLAVAVVRGDSLLFARGYGTLVVGAEDPVDAHTRFAIGSTTKAMTAAAIAMLVEEGRVDWQDPVIDHLPWFRLRDPWVTRELRVIDLLTHNAGLGNTDFLWYEQDVGTQSAGEVEGLYAVGRLSDHLQRRVRAEDHDEPGADEVLVVGNDNANGHDSASTGSTASTTQPPSGPGRAVRDPPRSWARSAMPSSPKPAWGVAPDWVRPSSVTRNRMVAPSRRTSIATRVGLDACRRALVKDSCASR